jgi:hypothetical protein
MQYKNTEIRITKIMETVTSGPIKECVPLDNKLSIRYLIFCKLDIFLMQNLQNKKFHIKRGLYIDINILNYRWQMEKYKAFKNPGIYSTVRVTTWVVMDKNY